jgi:hypothetical protein
MSVGVLMDEQVQSAITSGLRRLGIDVVTAQEDGSDGLADSDLLDRAAILRRIVFTRDSDFLAIAAARQAAGEYFIGVVYAKQEVVSYRQCIDDLELLRSVENWATLRIESISYRCGKSSSTYE